MISSTDIAREMADRSIRWIVVCCLVGRLLTTFTDVGPALLLDADPSEWAVWLATAVAVIDVLLLVGLSWGRLTWIVTSWWFPALDVAVAIGINIFVVSLMPPGTFWLEGHDPLGAYLAGTMAVWAAIRGDLRVGGVLLAGYAGVVAVEALGNGAPFDEFGWLAFGELVVWALISMSIGMSVMLLARAAARRTAVDVADATNESAMVKLHNSVLQVLTQVGFLSRGDNPPAVVLAEIRDLASKQATAAAVGAEGLALTGYEDLVAVVDRARRGCSGVVVEMRTEPVFEIPYDVADVVAEAVIEALTNVEKHAGVTCARIHIARSDSGAEIAISDDGVGITGGRAGFGLRSGIIMQMEGIGGTAVIDSESGRGTTVRLSVPREPRSITRFTETAIDWFVVVPVLLRALVTVANVLAAPLALDHGLGAYGVVAVIITTANLALLGVVAAKRDTGLLRNRVFFVLDLAVAAGLVLLTAVLLPTGTAAELTLLNTTVYIVPTVPLWGAVWGLRTGVALLGGAFVLEFLAAAVNGVRPSWAALVQIIAHYAQIPAAFILARLVMRLSRRGFDRAFTEARRAVLADMFAVAASSMTQLATVAAGPATTERLQQVRGIALATADDLDRTLFTLQRGLPDQLRTLARSCRRSGVDVSLTIDNVPAGLPKKVIDAVAEVARVVLIAIADTGGETAVVYAPHREDGLVLSVRSYGVPLALDHDHLHQAMANAEGIVVVTQPSSGGTEVEITWPS